MTWPSSDLGAEPFLDRTGEAAAAEFVWRRLRRYDLRLLEWFKLLPLSGRHALRGLCRYPLRAAPRSSELLQGYRVTASANVRPDFYPHRCALAVGTVRREIASRRGARLGWSYVLERVTFRSAADTLVFVAGHEAFHFLRHSRQIAGRNTEPSANRFGLEWLRDWRETSLANAATAATAASTPARRRRARAYGEQLELDLAPRARRLGG